MTLRDNLVASLRQKPCTITELTKELEVTRTAVKHQLNWLLEHGLIRKGEIRRNEKAGKPAREYEIAPGSEDAASSAYAPFIVGLLEQLPEHLDRKQRKKLFESVGRNMAQHVGLPKADERDERLKDAIALVNSLGATAELIENDEEILVKNHTCPLAKAVRQEPCVCDAVAAFFTAATGAKIKANCSYGEMLICQYRLRKTENG